MSAQPGSSPDELAVGLVQVPDRDQLSLVNANIDVPINTAVAANVRSDGSIAHPTAGRL